jgi:hypothetical protein
MLQRVQPLLCNDCEMDGYIRVVTGQRLGKHVPAAKQQILNNSTVELQQWKRGVLRYPGSHTISKGQSQLIVLYGSL